MVVPVYRCGSRRTASGRSAGTLVPATTQRCGKCPRWGPGGAWTCGHRPVVPRWPQEPRVPSGGFSELARPPKVPILAPDCHYPAREVPLVGSRWAVDGRTPPGGPPVAARAFECHLELLRALGACPEWAPPGVAVRRLRGSVGQLGQWDGWQGKGPDLGILCRWPGKRHYRPSSDRRLGQRSLMKDVDSQGF